ncbi:hypothetical protein BDY21DRAFT_342045 [Lineolata rhizophorae]|uniref:Uncharacterized protein n=1 Tax=Lineolata rhizophorae TaxID=578093 RepID=A0A6A6P317_9PEZI|nr:hypothetical protein BDY21DRAFT_342045 [Lineolata rhizophorae]
MGTILTQTVARSLEVAMNPQEPSPPTSGPRIPKGPLKPPSKKQTNVFSYTEPAITPRDLLLQCSRKKDGTHPDAHAPALAPASRQYTCRLQQTRVSDISGNAPPLCSHQATRVQLRHPAVAVPRRKVRGAARRDAESEPERRRPGQRFSQCRDLKEAAEMLAPPSLQAASQPSSEAASRGTR